MSGLCGWFGVAPEREPPAASLARMADRLPTFGACERRSQATAAAGLCLNARAGEGHWHADPSLTVALEGYPRWNDPEWARLARDRGPGAAIAAAFRRYREGFLEHLRGAFSVAILDYAEGKALCAIDRAGLGTLCYARGPAGGVVFGTTTDAVAAFPGLQATVSAQSLHDFLYFVDRVPAPATIYAEQQKLAPGECLMLRDGAIAVRPYWRMRYSEDDARGVAELGPEMFAHLRTAVARIVEGEQSDRTGAFLSGGLDSSTVAGLLAERCGGSTRTYTVAFDLDAYDESDYARAAVDRFRTRHRECRVAPEDILALIPRLAEVYDEPFSNHSTVPTYYCARLARESGTDVLLGGDGGDELFAGNTRYLADRIFDRYRRIPAVLRRVVIEPLAAGASSLAPGFSLARKAGNYVRIARMPVPVRMTRSNLYERHGFGEVFDADFAAAIDPSRPLRFIQEVYEAATSPSAVKKMMHLDLRITLADGDLRKVNRMCELAGVRVRYPFMDDDVVEFSGRVPDRLMVKGGRLRAFYKEAASGFLPERIIAKKKHGFGLPFLEYSDRCRPLLELACDSVVALKRRRIFRDGYLDRMIEAHRGRDNGLYRGDIWDLMMIELWLRHHVDAQRSSDRIGSREARPVA
jgi:asparagine synthase (glutamine-hydrolysing)